MSFSARMKQVRTPAELDALMMEVRLRGSLNWTLEGVRRRVSRSLWPVLHAHFDEDGRILGPPAASPEGKNQQIERVSTLNIVHSLHEELSRARARAIVTYAGHEAESAERIDEVQSHRFVDGWCRNCGASLEAVERWAYPCENAS